MPPFGDDEAMTPNTCCWYVNTHGIHFSFPLQRTAPAFTTLLRPRNSALEATSPQLFTSLPNIIGQLKGQAGIYGSVEPPDKK
jgi:hypothetical protein